MSTPEDEVATWPELDDEAKARLRELMRSGRGLAKIDQDDVDTAVYTIREIAEVTHHG